MSSVQFERYQKPKASHQQERKPVKVAPRRRRARYARLPPAFAYAYRKTGFIATAYNLAQIKPAKICGAGVRSLLSITSERQAAAGRGPITASRKKPYDGVV